MAGEEKKGEAKTSIGKEDLVKKFENLNSTLGVTNTNIGKLQQALGQEQTKSQQILGAMQITGEMLAEVVGVDEAQKILTAIQNPKKEEVKEDGKKD